MDEYQNAMEELRDIVEGISKLRDAAYTHYSLLVEQVLKDRITDEQQLERIMDGLCDFCDEIRFIELYRSLCRHMLSTTLPQKMRSVPTSTTGPSCLCGIEMVAR